MDERSELDDVTPEELAESRRYSMSIDWSEEDDAFIVRFPGVPGVRTHGATREEAAERGEEVITMWLTALRDAGRPVPPPMSAKHVTVERPSTYDAKRIQTIRRDLGVSQRVFAEMLNVSLATVRSWEQGVRTPDGASSRLLDIAERYPDAIVEAVSPLRRTG